ncbi:MAG: FAD-binding protein [Candidatus Vogelbacteria bacterium]|nr:FAD-binding protein [Candidatus Vogelbacteria bacterium]
MEKIKTTDIVIVGAGFSGLYLAHHLIVGGKHDFLIVAPDMKTVSDKSYFNIRSRGVKQTSLKESMSLASYGKSNKQLVSIFVNNIDDELTYLSHLTKMEPSYLGAKVSNPKLLLNKIKKESDFSRIYAEVISVKKSRKYVEVVTSQGVIHCQKIVFCFGGLRARLSDKFVDERVQNNMFEIVRAAGCTVMYQDLVMRHPFYSKGVCIPSDNLYSFDFIDEKNKRLKLTHDLVRAHNAHHRFDDICKEYQKTAKRYAVNGKQRIELDIEPHFVLGGIRINKRGETKVKNMYALGECAYGMHGKGRLGGGSIGEILVMSRVIAKQIIG